VASIRVNAICPGAINTRMPRVFVNRPDQAVTTKPIRKR
jgi:NAD(P)-dependent dehydrogenase (short-subunit alcohol dehydrogenase family)